MGKFIALFMTFAVLIAAGSVMASEENVFTCSLNKAFECSHDEGCKQWTVQEVALPRFIRIDLKAKTIKSLDKDVARESKFRDMERREGMIILQGTEQRGWSMALGENSRDITLSASGDGESFVVFGSCINP
jgi:hypothetical protein